jgi:uncharacterized protein YutE (UPF0331/DUF86 family)
MKINGVVTRKIEIIAETLRELHQLENVSTALLDSDFFLRKGVERSLQICVEAMIDIAHRIISLESQPPCSTAGKALEAIEALGAIDNASSYKPMVQFRNVVVHRYENIDTDIIVGILKRNLNDFDRYISEILKYVTGQS